MYCQKKSNLNYNRSKEDNFFFVNGIRTNLNNICNTKMNRIKYKKSLANFVQIRPNSLFSKLSIFTRYSTLLRDFGANFVQICRKKSIEKISVWPISTESGGNFFQIRPNLIDFQSFSKNLYSLSHIEPKTILVKKIENQSNFSKSVKSCQNHKIFWSFL